MNPLNTEDILYHHLDKIEDMLKEGPEINDMNDIREFNEEIFIHLMSVKEIIKLIYR